MTPTERETLIKVRNGLASGDYVHVQDERPAHGKRVFDMDVASKTCGTVACIGGWMAMDMGLKTVIEVSNYVSSGGHESDMRGLFFPDIDGNFSRITPAQAVQAIDNFLQGEDPCWEEILNG